MRLFYRASFVVLLLSQLASAAVDPARIDLALDKAKQFLYSRQNDGNWEQAIPGKADSHGDQKTGYTALAVYALLAAGESHQDPRIVKAIEYLQTTDTTGVYALGLRCQVWLLLPQSPEVKRAMAKDARILRDSIITEGKGRGFYGYNPGSRNYSHSRAQYAVLGLWAAAQTGVEVPDSYWQLVERCWIEDQDPGGGWCYYDKPRDGYPITAGMTAVGVATLFITQDFLHANEGAGCRGNIRNPHIDKGLKWITDNIDDIATDERLERGFPYSTIYAIERIGVASGLKYLNTIDWFDHGAQWLLRKQKRDGSWPSEFGNVTSTSFAMLFLARGRAPVAFNKLDYSTPLAKKQPPWNQRPREIANLSRWIGRQTERDLNWQIVNHSATAEDLHDAPILYLAGNEPLALSPELKAKIKRFVEQGGLVLANADCGGREFANSFRALGKELFPSYEFRELPADHLIYTNQQFPREKWKAKPSVLGMSNGVRELMLLIPQSDPAKAWQLQLVGGREELWQLGANIFLYSIDKQNLRSKGQTYLVARNAQIKPNLTLKIARIQYDGNWDPEPAGWERLGNLMSNREKIALDIVTAKPEVGALAGAKVAHLTGTTRFSLDDPARQALRKFVEGGGTLVIDAAGGSSEFAQAAEAELAAIFPESKLTTLPPDHPLFSAGGTKLTGIAYRPFAARTLGSLKDAPRLQAIEVGGRAAVIYSREDLSAGMVGHPMDGITGYTPATATELMCRVVLNAAGAPGAASKPARTPTTNRS